MEDSVTQFKKLVGDLTEWAQHLNERKAAAAVQQTPHDTAVQLATTFNTPEMASALRNKVGQPLIENMHDTKLQDDITRYKLNQTEVDITACDLGIRPWGGIGSFWQVGTIGAQNTPVGTIGKDAGLKRGIQGLER